MFTTEIISASAMMVVVINPFSKMFYIMILKEQYSEKDLIYVVSRSNLIGLLILIIFAIAGSFILSVIFNIDVNALRIAGGIVLAKIGFTYLEKGGKFTIEKTQSILEMSAVPIATPLIAGPAAITTVITISVEYSILVACFATTIAIIINSLFMLSSLFISERLGKTTISILIRILGLFIMAVGIQMIIIGTENFIPQ